MSDAPEAPGAAALARADSGHDEFEGADSVDVTAGTLDPGARDEVGPSEAADDAQAAGPETSAQAEITASAERSDAHPAEREATAAHGEHAAAGAVSPVGDADNAPAASPAGDMRMDAEDSRRFAAEPDSAASPATDSVTGAGSEDETRGD